MKKIIFLFLIVYFLTLLQVSFFIHFPIFGITPNFVLIFTIIINLFTPRYQWQGVLAGLIAGISLDIFSSGNNIFFGLYTLIFLAISLFIKFILKRHVRIPLVKRA